MGLRYPGDLVVEVCRDVVVEEVDEVLDDQVRSARLLALPHPLVHSEYVDDLVGEVVLRPDSRLEGNRGPDREGGNGEDVEDEQLRPRRGGVERREAQEGVR